jgi:mono/diheme cytochrome c family protein
MLGLAVGIFLCAGAAGGNEKSQRSTGTASKVATKQQDEETERIEGEKRFHANCSRCHQYPHKFPPRMMATIVRHMRVRATITDEDMRLVLRYMTQ